MAYVRTVKTASGATAEQIVWSTRRGSRQIEHLGSAHDDAEVEALKAAARQRLAEGQGALDLGLDAVGASGWAAVGDRRDGAPSRWMQVWRPEALMVRTEHAAPMLSSCCHGPATNKTAATCREPFIERDTSPRVIATTSSGQPPHAR